MELEDMQDLDSCAARRAGSNPARGILSRLWYNGITSHCRCENSGPIPDRRFDGAMVK